MQLVISKNILKLKNWTTKNSRLSILVIVLFGTVAIMTNLNNGLWNKKHGVVIHDVISYYSYLPAFFIYHDLSFSYLDKNPAFFEGRVFNSKTKDGGHYQKMTMGLSFLYLPFFLMGYLSAWISGSPIDGYSAPFMFFLVFGATFYVIAGLFVLRKTLSRYFDDTTIAITLLFITLGTNLIYYTTLESTMSHAYNFALVAFFLYLTIVWHENPNNKNSIFIGLIYGLITLIRPTNGLIVLFFILYTIRSKSDFYRKFLFYTQNFKMLLLISFIAILVLVPQLLFWKSNTGHWLFWSYSEEGFFFTKPEIIRGLFSYRKGWLLYTPIMIFGLAGIFILRDRLKSFYLPILIFTILNIYVIFSWWDWSYGGSFGARAMIDTYALFSVSMAAFVEYIRNSKRFIKIATMGLMIILFLFNIFQTLQYKYGAIHFCEMSKESYWHSFGKLGADQEFFNLLEPLDYKKLIKGEYATIPKIRETIGPASETSFEEFSRWGTQFLSLNQHYVYNNAAYQTEINKHSGQHSILLSGDKKFGANTEFYVKPGEKYSLSVWKYPPKASASLVMAAIDPKEFYFQKETITQTDSIGWGLISYEAIIPDSCNGKYRVYLWNKTTDSVFFDDLIIRKLK
jgi:hypothetical protein